MKRLALRQGLGHVLERFMVPNGVVLAFVLRCPWLR